MFLRISTMFWMVCWKLAEMLIIVQVDAGQESDK